MQYIRCESGKPDIVVLSATCGKKLAVGRWPNVLRTDKYMKSLTLWPCISPHPGDHFSTGTVFEWKCFCA